MNIISVYIILSSIFEIKNVIAKLIIFVVYMISNIIEIKAKRKVW